MIYRELSDLYSFTTANKALVIYGPRRVGKTTLLRNFLSHTTLKYKLEVGENIRFKELISSQDFKLIEEYASGYELIAIDEAQAIPNIGQGIKILIDQIPNMRVIATGSSAFELSQYIGEPLTGRKRTIKLFPIAQMELLHDMNKFELKQQLSEYLIFGQYPDILLAKSKQDKILLLQELVESYLLKDILSLDRVKGAGPLLQLLKLLAFQVGNLVSLNELATQLHLDVKTIGRYIDLLEKSFVLYKLGGFSSNLRNEVTAQHKYYFLDNGIRNAIISQFNELSSRNDIGALWENFLIIERLKKQSYAGFYGNQYFLRTYDKKEIDLIEECDNVLQAYEFKWSKKNITKINSFWQKTYQGRPIELINTENYLNFIC